MSNLALKTQATKDQGRLVGWLVSYELEQAGAAFEIRCGRLFIGSQRVPQLPMIEVKGSGIEDLHLLLKASNNHKLMAQDLFTSSSSYITRGTTKQETRIASPMQLRHGDWLRVGTKTRFQVCLLDGPGK